MSSSERTTARARARASLEKMTPEEDAALTAAAEADPDNPPLTPEDFARMQPVRRRGAGRAPRKQLVSLRIDPDVVEHFRATGEGWQARINAALRKAAGL